MEMPEGNAEFREAITLVVLDRLLVTEVLAHPIGSRIRATLARDEAFLVTVPENTQRVDDFKSALVKNEGMRSLVCKAILETCTVEDITEIEPLWNSVKAALKDDEDFCEEIVLRNLAVVKRKMEELESSLQEAYDAIDEANNYASDLRSQASDCESSCDDARDHITDAQTTFEEIEKELKK